MRTPLSMFFAACGLLVSSGPVRAAEPPAATAPPASASTRVPAPVRFAFVYRVELPAGAALPAATIVASREARDFAELQTRISGLAKVRPEEVVLRDWATVRDPQPRLERQGAGAPSHRVRLCGPGGTLLAEAVIPPDGGVLLVPVARDGRSAVFAYRERLVPQEDLAWLAGHEQALTVEAERLVAGSRFPEEFVASVGPCR